MNEKTELLESIKSTEKIRSKSEEDLRGSYSGFNGLCEGKGPPRQEVSAGVYKGEVTLIVSATNLGKSTLLLNTILAILAGKPFPPLVTEGIKPAKILLLDCESTLDGLRRDIAIMREPVRDKSKIDSKKNPVWLKLWVDAYVCDEPLSLDKPNYFNRLERTVRDQHIELVIIDTLSSAFNTKDENDNASVARTIMKPLARLAKENNCAVIIAHHTGKQNEGGSGGTPAYLGRGASNLGALSRTVMVLEPDKNKRGRLRSPKMRQDKGKGF